MTELTERNSRHYDQLPSKDSIRLIQLQAAVHSEPISFSLAITSFPDSSPYHALSYCWGDAGDVVQTECNNEPFYVTSNLYSALQRLRSFYGHCRFWVDAICINQHNAVERSDQVAIMRQIYKCAERVDVWLGCSDTDTVTAVSAIENLAIQWCSSAYGPDSRAGWVERLRMEDDSGKVLASIPDIAEGSEDYWKVTGDLFRRPWFTRLWVIQEVQSCRDVLVHCGETSIEWEFVALVARWRHRQLQLRTLDSHSKSRGVRQVQTMRERLTSRRAVPFLQILGYARNSQSTDPRDKVFSMLHHPINPESDVEQPMPSSYLSNSERDGKFSSSAGHLGMRADYSRQTSEIYREVAIRSVQQCSSLEIFDYAGSDDSLKKLSSDHPSWVPRWDLTDNYMPQPSASFLYDASAGTKLGLSSMNHANILLRGIRLGKVSYADCVMPIGSQESVDKCQMLSSSSKLGTDWLMSLSRLIVHDQYESRFGNDRALERTTDSPERHFADFAAFIMDRNHGRDSIETFIPLVRFWCSECGDLIANSNSVGNDCPLRWACSSCSTGEYDLCDSCYDKGHRCPSQGHNTSRLPITSLHYIPDEAVLQRLREASPGGDALAFSARVRSQAWRRTFISTASGFIGCSTQGTREGDIVVIFFGAKTPSTLRRHGKYYQLIGPCYIHGVMDGEAIESGAFVEEEFDLR